MSKKTSNLSQRMRNYEGCFDIKLPKRMPILGRLDGHAWHSYTRKCQKPFDEKVINTLNSAVLDLCKFVEGAVLAYIQSDEISLLLFNYKTLKTQAWVENRLEKMCSLSAGRISSSLSIKSVEIFGKQIQTEFDAKFWVVSEAEVCNYFIERQQDATRNSIQMVAQSMYSPKELHKKNSSQLQEMIYQKGTNWNNIATHLKRGRCAIKTTNKMGRPSWVIDNDIPIFSQNREYIENRLINNV